MDNYKFNLKDLAREKHWKADMIATKTGVSRQTVYSLLRPGAGGIKFETIRKLCAGLGGTPNDLFGVDARPTRLNPPAAEYAAAMRESDERFANRPEADK